jgi:hypothetical protein
MGVVPLLLATPQHGFDSPAQLQLRIAMVLCCAHRWTGWHCLPHGVALGEKVVNRGCACRRGGNEMLSWSQGRLFSRVRIPHR